MSQAYCIEIIMQKEYLENKYQRQQKWIVTQIIYMSCQLISLSPTYTDTHIYDPKHIVLTHTHIISLVTYLQHINIIEFSIFLIDKPCRIDIVSASCTCIYVCNLFIYNFYYIHALSVSLLSMSVMSISIINCTCILYPHPCFTKYIFG